MCSCWRQGWDGCVHGKDSETLAFAIIMHCAIEVSFPNAIVELMVFMMVTGQMSVQLC